MSKEYATIREKIEDGEVRLEVTENRARSSEHEKTITLKDAMTCVGYQDEYTALVEDYIEIVNEICGTIEKQEDGRISKIEEMWEIGRVLDEHDDGEFPNLQILGCIFSEKRGYSSDSFSVHRKIYEAFPEKSFSNEHGQTEIREFIMQPENNDRGRRGYDRYNDKKYDWPKPVRRAWCVTSEGSLTRDETIQSFAQTMLNKYQSSRKTKPSRQILASYLCEMTDVADTVNEISTEEALEYL